MENTDIFLGLISLVVVMLGWFLNRLADTVDSLERNMSNCQNNMPINYVLKSDYKIDMSEIKQMLSDIYGIIRKERK
jgi:glucose uptake protein GlcU